MSATMRELEKSRLLLTSSLEAQKDTILFSIDHDYRYLYFNKAQVDVMKRAYGADDRDRCLRARLHHR